ncbi:MAG: DUF853 family protein [Coriobacteriia bacterium]|nr:DUF853 family protein [Coriobacteriia bacterium]
MLRGDKIWMGQGEESCYLLLNQANRHGLITGASGTGKTVTLKVMAEGFSHAGVPVFMADAKGDVAGMCEAGTENENVTKRVTKFGIEDWEFKNCPVRFWDMTGGTGIPVRITISDMGPIMLSRLLGLTDVQEGVLNIVFRIADDRGMLLIDLKDLRAMLNYVGEHAAEYATEYGAIAKQSIGAIQRALIAVEDQGGEVFFGEPNLDLNDWFQTAADGKGVVNVLNAAKLITMPQIYAMFLLWMLSHLFDTLPEVGDPDKPKFVFFFDEAHLLFNGMPKELRDRIVQVVKLIRSKGVGVYFITQSPSDIPDEVLAQLSNKVQHALRAYTPAEQKAVKAAASSFRENPAFKAVDVITELGTGEALVSFLDAEGTPSIVQRAKILPPQCSMNAPDPANVQKCMDDAFGLMNKYGEAIDRESAFEMIREEAEISAQQAALELERAKLERERAEFEKQKAIEAAKAEKEAERQRIAAEKEAERARIAAEKEAERQRIAAEKAAAAEEARRIREQQKRQDAMMRTATNAVNQIGREVGKQILRGIFGGRR